MQVNLNPDIVTALRVAKVELPDAGRWATGDEPLAVNLRDYKPEELQKIEAELKKIPEGIGIRRQISSWRKSVADPKNAKPGKLNVVEAALIDFFVNDSIEGWLFPMSDDPNPYAIKGVKYHPAEKESPAVVGITLECRTKDGYDHRQIYIYGEDAKSKTLVEILEGKGWQKETKELVSAYAKSFKKYKKLYGMFGQQLKITIPAQLDMRTSWWETVQHKVDLQALGGGKVICNHKIDDDTVVSKHGRHSYSRPSRRHWTESADLDSAVKTANEKNENEAFTSTPYNLELVVFHLEAHVDLDVHVNHLESYKWDPSIKEKLILPDDLMDLLDTLTEDMSFVQEDIVSGKTGGNVILCAGKPGLGKTLTAEVYSEYRKAPLYKVHSGMLGTDADSIEESLTQIYQRASAWGEVIVLLDEFDVFGRERGVDMEQNAVVAVFLRSLEYQNNTIFLTTNRADNMDDAILSRCAAILSYDFPKDDVLRDMWKTMRDQFLPSVTDEIIEEMMKPTEVERELSGRDIKSIMKLAAKYERRGRKVDATLLRKCAYFRGIQMV